MHDPSNINHKSISKDVCRARVFKTELMLLSPVEVLDKTYEYVCRENILMAMENNDVNNAQAKALLKAPTSLTDVYNKYASWEHGGQQEEIWNAVEARSGEVLRAEFAAAQRSER